MAFRYDVSYTTIIEHGIGANKQAYRRTESWYMELFGHSLWIDSCAIISNSIAIQYCVD